MRFKNEMNYRDTLNRKFRKSKTSAPFKNLRVKKRQVGNEDSKVLLKEKP